MACEANKIQQTSDGETGVAGSASLSAPDRARLVRVLGVGALLTVSGGRDQRIAAIAKLQRGRVSRKQLLAAGIDPSTVQRLLAKGWAERPQPEHARQPTAVRAIAIGRRHVAGQVTSPPRRGTSAMVHPHAAMVHPPPPVVGRVP
jgi:hypothetical protein